MEMRKSQVQHLLRDKRFWLASFLITWAVALQEHMMWIQRQDSFKEKFEDLNPDVEDAYENL